MAYTFNTLKKEAAKFGAVAEIDVYNSTDRAFQIVAPDGKQWADGNCVNMCVPFWTYVPEGQDGNKTAAIKEAINRMAFGLEDYDAELNG